jgi:hypothetical protein
MPRIIGEEIPKRLSFTFTHQNRKSVQTAMQNKEFTTVAECINTCIRVYFENHGKTVVTKEWMVSEEGKEYIKSIFHRCT